MASHWAQAKTGIPYYACQHDRPSFHHTRLIVSCAPLDYCTESIWATFQLHKRNKLFCASEPLHMLSSPPLTTNSAISSFTLPSSHRSRVLREGLFDCRFYVLKASSTFLSVHLSQLQINEWLHCWLLTSWFHWPMDMLVETLDR